MPCVREAACRNVARPGREISARFVPFPNPKPSLCRKLMMVKIRRPAFLPDFIEFRLSSACLAQAACSLGAFIPHPGLVVFSRFEPPWPRSARCRPQWTSIRLHLSSSTSAVLPNCNSSRALTFSLQFFHPPARSLSPRVHLGLSHMSIGPNRSAPRASDGFSISVYQSIEKDYSPAGDFPLNF